ncbi:uncharacterized protein TNCV_1037271 [Trichonephila clavipes]|nr:uncharacterized protein TNCV_1037271 [Trichonephila clavipes]
MAALVSEYTLEFFTLLNARSKKELIEWCMKEGLIASSYECPKCNEQMGLNERKSVVLDGFEWRCRKKLHYQIESFRCIKHSTPEFYQCRALQKVDHPCIRKARRVSFTMNQEARIKNKQLKCRQEDDLADDTSTKL